MSSDEKVLLPDKKKSLFKNEIKKTTFFDMF